MIETIDLARMRQHNEAAHAMVSALNQPRDAPAARRWSRSIPARPDSDPDLVIGAALSDLDTLLAVVEAQEGELAAARELAETTRVVLWQSPVPVAETRRIADALRRWDALMGGGARRAGWAAIRPVGGEEDEE